MPSVRIGRCSWFHCVFDAAGTMRAFVTSLCIPCAAKSRLQDHIWRSSRMGLSRRSTIARLNGVWRLRNTRDVAPACGGAQALSARRFEHRPWEASLTCPPLVPRSLWEPWGIALRLGPRAPQATLSSPNGMAAYGPHASVVSTSPISVERRVAHCSTDDEDGGIEDAHVRFSRFEQWPTFR